MYGQAFGNGNLRLPLTKRKYFVVWGGPYMKKPSGMYGVKMAKEIALPCEVDIPTADFQTPNRLELYRGLEKAVDLILSGKPVYIGCMGGMGRTGLFLAILVKAFGVKNPVEFTRKNYYSHAVETKEQYDYVKSFIINPRVRTKIKQFKRKNWYKVWQTDLTKQW